MADDYDDEDDDTDGADGMNENGDGDKKGVEYPAFYVSPQMYKQSGDKTEEPGTEPKPGSGTVKLLVSNLPKQGVTADDIYHFLQQVKTIIML